MDSSAWFSSLNKQDPRHRDVRTALEAWRGRLVTHSYIFDETLTLVKAKEGHAMAQRAGVLLRRSEIVELVRVTADDEDVAWEYFCRHADKTYSFTDCVSFAVMQRLNIARAVTLDRDFSRAGFETEPDAREGGRVSERLLRYRARRRQRSRSSP